MIAEQVWIEANNINVALRQRDWARRRAERRTLLGQAVAASLEGLRVLAEEPLITDTVAYVNTAFERLGNGQAVLEELRHDGLSLRMFIRAERKLLQDLGVDSGLLDGLGDALLSIILDEAPTPETNLSERLDALASELAQDLAAIRREIERDGTASRVAAALGVLGGSVIVAANSAAAIGSGGFAVGLAGASVSAGSAMVGRSLEDALGGG